MHPPVGIAARHNLVVIEDAAEHTAPSITVAGRLNRTPGLLQLLLLQESGGVRRNRAPSPPPTRSSPCGWRCCPITARRSATIARNLVQLTFARTQGGDLRVKLRYKDEWNIRRREHARTDAQMLAGTPLRLPCVAPDPQPHLVRAGSGDSRARQLKSEARGARHPYGHSFFRFRFTSKSSAERLATVEGGLPNIEHGHAKRCRCRCSRSFATSQSSGLQRRSVARNETESNVSNSCWFGCPPST
jgi:hypothetical protein